MISKVDQNTLTWWRIFWQPSTVANIFHLQWSRLKSILLITRVLQLAFFLMKVFVKLSVNWLSLRENISDHRTLRPNFRDITDSTNPCLLCLVPGIPWIQQIQRLFERIQLSGKDIPRYQRDVPMSQWQAFREAIQWILFSWPLGYETLCWNLNGCSSLEVWTIKKPLAA